MKTLIIAEAGVNHNGNFDLACKLALEAKKAGADIVKYQTFNADKLVSKFAEKANYQKKFTNNNETQLEMLKKLSLNCEEFKELKQYCDDIGIMFLSTAFDLESVEFLYNLGMNIWKIPSGEITNLPLLVKIANYNQPILMSTGMCNISEIEEAIKILNDNGADNITLLHCTTEYPAPIEDVNLNAMLTLKRRFNFKVGYSDHTKGIEIPIAAVAMGATVIEKHFTLDKNMEGPDHKASLEPNELNEMVKCVRNIEKALGDGEKRISNSESKNIAIARKSIVAKKDIKKNEILSENNITTKRPGNGVSPMKWFDVLGTKAIRDFKEDELIEL